MDLRRLRYFVAVAEELHFGRAARRLFVAQPSLSRAIRTLERELGADLFTRDRHTVALTAAGRALLDPGRQVLAAAADLPVLARAAAGADRLTIGYVPYARSRVSGLVDAVRAARPGVQVTVFSAGDSPEVVAGLRQGTIDAGILRAPLPDAAGLRVRTLAVEAFHVALPAGHPLTGHRQVRLADLRSETFALFPRELNPPAHDDLMAYFARAGFAPRVGQASRRMDESLMFVASGGGVATFPASVAGTVGDPAIEFRLLVDPTPTVEIVVAWAGDSPNPVLADLVRAARGGPGGPGGGAGGTLAG